MIPEGMNLTNGNLRHLVSIQTGMKGFSASFPAVCTQKGPPLRLILKRSALMVFGTGTYALLYTVICYDVPSFDFLLHKCCKSGEVSCKRNGDFLSKSSDSSYPSFIAIHTDMIMNGYRGVIKIRSSVFNSTLCPISIFNSNLYCFEHIIEPIFRCIICLKASGAHNMANGI